MIASPRHRQEDVISQIGRCIRIGGALLVLVGCSRSPDRPMHPGRHTASLPARVSVTAASDSADDGQWIMPARNYASTRYSSLSQISAQNVGQLKLAWTFSTGVTRGHEAAPLVVDNTMYIVTPFPNYLYALDLTQPGAPAKWT